MMNQKIKIVMVGMLATVFIFLLPAPSHATVGGSAISFTGCTAGGVVGNILQNKIGEGLKKAEDWIKGKSGLSSSFGTAVPVNDEEFIGKFTQKNFRNNVIGRCATREVINAINGNILNVMRTGGRDGGVTFVKNWRTFETQSQYRGENIFRSTLASAPLCSYVGKDIRNLFGANQKTPPLGQNLRVNNLDPFSTRVGCTLPKDFNIADYQKDFSGNGGWEAWSRLLEPQNNYYGLLFQSLDEAGTQRNAEVNTDSTEALAGQGFTSKRGSSASDSCKSKGANGQCLSYKDIQTPGIIIKDSVSATLQSEFAWLGSISDINELISTGVQVILNRLTDLGNPNEGDYKAYEAPAECKAPGTGGSLPDCIVPGGGVPGGDVPGRGVPGGGVPGKSF